MFCKNETITNTKTHKITLLNRIYNIRQKIHNNNIYNKNNNNNNNTHLIGSSYVQLKTHIFM